jgi:hypothetical protein
MVRQRYALIAKILDHAVQQGQQALAFAGQGERPVVGNDLDSGAERLIGADFLINNPETSITLRGDLQDAELFHLPVDDFGQRANTVRFGRQAGFITTFDQADAEGFALLQADGGHVEVALLKNFQWQYAAGKSTVLSGNNEILRISMVGEFTEREASNQPIIHPSVA